MIRIERTTEQLKVIVVRQPWAWLICHGPKDVENRPTAWRYRGRLLISASANAPSRSKWDAAVEFARARGVKVPPREQLERGGIIGTAVVVDCVQSHPSPWFEGPNGLLLRDRRPLPFTKIVGRLGIFDPPADVMERLSSHL